jgi:predicted lysophospholipase L1 biosynthesis ABC-type transport system permease subunit
MQVEELFRDQKNRRNGWALRNTRFRHVDRFDRFLLILALAYLLLAGLASISTVQAPAKTDQGVTDCALKRI